MPVVLWGLFFAILTSSCGKTTESSSSKSYSFSSTANSLLKSSTTLLRNSNSSGLQLDGSSSTGGAGTLCSTGQTITCAGPTAMTGKYFSVGLLIQSNGNGMQSYLLADNWNGITASSTTYEFDAKNPIKSSGNLICCGGSGDLSSQNTYFSNGSFLFAFLDLTFKVPYSTTQKTRVSAEMSGSHTVRFVMVDGILTSYKRGDLLYKDGDGIFKWIDSSSGVMSATRPTSPVTMNSSVVNYTSPFDGLTSPIPIIYTEINEIAGSKITTSEESLKQSGKVYSFDFNAGSLVVFMLKSDELELISSKKELLSRIHLSGLPHSSFTFGTSGTSTLTIE